MSTKRPAPGNIDEKTLQYVDNPIPNPTASSDKSDRNIVSVKKDNTNEVPNEAPQKDTPKQNNDSQKPTTSVFKNLFSNGNAGVGLFKGIGTFSSAKQAQNNNKDAPNIDLKSNNLFTGNGFPTLFGSNETGNNTRTIFGQSLTSGKGLIFSGFKDKVDGKSSIFNFDNTSNIPPVRNGDDDDEGDSADLEKAQMMEIDKSKSKVKYDYKDQVKLLFSGSVRKFKKNNGDLMEGVEVVFQHDEKSDVFYLIIRLAATKNPIFTSFVLKNKSEVRTMNNKDQNIEVSVFILNKDKKMQLNRVKLQLDSSQNGKQLSSKLKDAIEGKIVANPDNEKAEEKKEENKE